MTTSDLSIAELSILHSLHDGDDPILRAPDSALIFFTRDVARLLQRGLVVRSGRSLALTAAGLDEIAKPCARAEGLGF